MAKSKGGAKRDRKKKGRRHDPKNGRYHIELKQGLVNSYTGIWVTPVNLSVKSAKTTNDAAKLADKKTYNESRNLYARAKRGVNGDSMRTVPVSRIDGKKHHA